MSVASVGSVLFIVATAGVALLVLQFVHLAWVVRWANRRTLGTNYCGLPLNQRRRFRAWLRIHTLLLSPMLWLLRKTKEFHLAEATFHFRGTAAPRGGACNPASFERAVQYRPRPEDVFVVTPMRCGTTWMQHLVFQVLSRGTRDLMQEDLTLNVVSPWLESDRTVDVADAPLVGEEVPSHIIKTHLPTSLCPYDALAKYIYVIRHPVSCFASCVDFVRNNACGFDVPLDELVRWYTSDELMWWGTWPSHFDGWYVRAEQQSNVLVVRYEDMKQDPEAVVCRVADFLEMAPLTDEECQGVLRKCSYQYMRQNADAFEMHPPHLLQVPESFFVSGKANRYADVDEELHDRLVQWCRDELADRETTADGVYGELSARVEALA